MSEQELEEGDWVNIEAVRGPYMISKIADDYALLVHVTDKPVKDEDWRIQPLSALTWIANYQTELRTKASQWLSSVLRRYA